MNTMPASTVTVTSMKLTKRELAVLMEMTIYGTRVLHEAHKQQGREFPVPDDLTDVNEIYSYLGETAGYTAFGEIDYLLGRLYDEILNYDIQNEADKRLASLKPSSEYLH